MADSMTMHTTITSDWRTGLPARTGARVTIRELRTSDATSLFAMLTSAEVSRFISPPPATVEGFERFIMWAQREREAGCCACFAVVPHEMDSAIGTILVRQLEPGFGTAEWQFAIDSAFWGTGVFVEAANLVLDFAFGTIGVHRLEARSAVANGRGQGALRKMGATCEAVLRRSFRRNGQELDQTIWSILDEDWLASRSSTRVQVKLH